MAALIGVALGACMAAVGTSPRTASPAGAETSSPLPPVATRSQVPVVTPPQQRIVEVAGSVTALGTSDLIRLLKAGGFDAVPVNSSGAAPLFGADRLDYIRIGTEIAVAYVYSSADAADRGFAIASDGSKNTVTWAAVPYFVRFERSFLVMTWRDKEAASRILDFLAAAR